MVAQLELIKNYQEIVPKRFKTIHGFEKEVFVEKY